MNRSRATFVCWVLGLAGAAAAQVVPTGFAVETLLDGGLFHPTDFCFLPDGRVLVVAANGQLALWAGMSTTATPVGTVPGVSGSLGFTGVPSIAADPAFGSNGYVYVLYAKFDGLLHLDRFTCTGVLTGPTSTSLQLAPATRHVLLDTIPNATFDSRSSTVRFGPDGMLYVATDDDDSACAAQQPLARNGCLLRLDVSQRPPGGSSVAPAYSALDPGTNPFSANTDFSQLLLGIGLHAPSRLEIDPATGNLYLGDAGATLAHEVSEYVRPATGSLPFVNFGWPWFEGALAAAGCGGPAPTGTLAPIVTVPSSSGWLHVVSGARYRNQQGPNDYGPGYDGDVFFADHHTGEIRRLTWQGFWQPAAPVAGQPTPAAWATGFHTMVALRLGPDGALWVMQQPSGQNGLLRRLRPPSSMPTVLPISGDGQRVPAGEPFPQPIVVRVFDPMLNPAPGAPVHFTLLGGGVLSTSNPVLADAQGYASTTVTSTFGGSVTVTASTPGSLPTAPFRLFGRRLSTSLAGNLFFVQVDNQTDAVPAFVPYIVMLAFPGSPTLPTPIGPLCVDPTWALSLVFEDGIGAFGGISLSGAGAIGMPGLYRQYSLPPGVFTGSLIRFQAVGIDPLTGWFRTNCTTRLF